MEIEGKIWKSQKHWLVEISSLDVMTQGHTRKEALEMLKDAIFELLLSYYGKAAVKKLEIIIKDHEKEMISLVFSDIKLLVAFSLKRQREKAGITVREASKRLGSTSPNAYAQYENAKINPTLDKLEELFRAINPKMQLKIA